MECERQSTPSRFYQSDVVADPRFWPEVECFGRHLGERTILRKKIKKYKYYANTNWYIKLPVLAQVFFE